MTKSIIIELSNKIGCHDAYYFKCHRQHWVLVTPDRPTEEYRRVFLTWHNELHRER